MKKGLKCWHMNVELNECEKEYLKLPNSMTDFVKMDEEKMKTEIHTMAAKLRMSVRRST